MHKRDPVICKQVTATGFGFYTPEEIRRLSVKEITSGKVFFSRLPAGLVSLLHVIESNAMLARTHLLLGLGPVQVTFYSD